MAFFMLFTIIYGIFHAYQSLKGKAAKTLDGGWDSTHTLLILTSTAYSLLRDFVEL